MQNVYIMLVHNHEQCFRYAYQLCINTSQHLENEDNLVEELVFFFFKYLDYRLKSHH